MSPHRTLIKAAETGLIEKLGRGSGLAFAIAVDQDQMAATARRQINIVSGHHPQAAAADALPDFGQQL
ncbi:MAG: hypothetical protein Tsb002_18570 [Wenzhouxiangellaceae bacterium]